MGIKRFFAGARTIRKIFLTVFLLVLFLSNANFSSTKASASWYSSSWHYRRAITVVNSSSTDLKTYQSKVVLTSSNLNFSKAKIDGSDLRFTSSDGVTLIDYWIESYNSSSQLATIWVEVPSIPASSSATIYVYYGNAVASAASNGLATFVGRGFENFEAYNTGTFTGQDPALLAPWTEHAGNPVMSANADSGSGTVLKVGSTYHMYFGWANIQHATSSDGITWSAPTTVLAGGGVCVVWIEGSTWYMLYRYGYSGVTKINLATSSDGLAWTPNAGNPVFFDAAATTTWLSAGGHEPYGLIKIDGTYYLYYSGWATSNRREGVATSTDLINWTPYARNPILSGGRFCGSPFYYNGYYYFTVPHYTDYQDASTTDKAEIELYRDTSPYFSPDTREFVKTLVSRDTTGGWESYSEDTPRVTTDNIFRNSFSTTNNQILMYFAGATGAANWATGVTVDTITDSLFAKQNERIRWSPSNSSEVTISNIQSRSGSNSARLNTTASRALRTSYFDPQDKAVFSTWMRKSNTTVATEMYLYSGTNLNAIASMGATGYFRYHNGTSYTTTSLAYSTNTWYQLNIEYNRPAGTFNYVVKDTNLNELLRINDIALTPARNISPVDNISIYTSSAGAVDLYVDDFSVRRFNTTEPVTTVQAEEIYVVPVESTTPLSGLLSGPLPTVGANIFGANKTKTTKIIYLVSTIIFLSLIVLPLPLYGLRRSRRKSK